MKLKKMLKSYKTLEIFFYAFGVICFSVVISPISYILSGIEHYGFESSAVVHLVIRFLFINVAISLLISIFLTRILGTRFVFSFLLFLFIYSATAQLFFHYGLFLKEIFHYHYWNLIAFSIGIFISFIFFMLSFIYQHNIISSFVKAVSNISSIILITLLSYSIILAYENTETQKNKINFQSDYLSDVYKNFKDSSRKKLSVFIILGDELPFSLISNGNVIKDSFPNIKALSEKSLFFTKAFSNYDGSSPSIPSVFTGKYLFIKEEKKLYNNDWMSEKRNLFVDLKECNYSTLISSDPFKIKNKLFSDNNAEDLFYNEKVLWNGTLNFLAHLYSFWKIDHFDYYYYAAKFFPTESMTGLFTGGPVFRYNYSVDTHFPYIPNDEEAGLPNSYLTPDNKAPIPLDQVPLVLKKQIKLLKAFDSFLGKEIDKILSHYGKDNVLIVLLSDHGIGWRPPLLGRCLGYISWDIVGVPLMIYCPSKLKPRVYDKPFPLIDLLPTIYDLIGLEYKKEEFDGISFFSKERERRKDIFSYSGSTESNQYVLRNGSWEKISPSHHRVH